MTLTRWPTRVATESRQADWHRGNITLSRLNTRNRTVATSATTNKKKHLKLVSKDLTITT